MIIVRKVPQLNHYRKFTVDVFFERSKLLVRFINVPHSEGRLGYFNPIYHEKKTQTTYKRNKDIQLSEILFIIAQI